MLLSSSYYRGQYCGNMDLCSLHLAFRSSSLVNYNNKKIHYILSLKMPVFCLLFLKSISKNRTNYMLITENWGGTHSNTQHSSGIKNNHLEIFMVTFWYIFFLSFASLCGYNYNIYSTSGFAFLINRCEKFSCYLNYENILTGCIS